MHHPSPTMKKLILIALIALAAILAQVFAYETATTYNGFAEWAPWDGLGDNGFAEWAPWDGLGDNSSGEKCAIRMEQLDHCQMHLTTDQGRTSSFNHKLRMLVMRHHEQEHDLQQCCQQLRQVDEQCKCEAIQQVFDQVARQQPGTGGQKKMMLQKAQMLPNACSFKVQQCPFRA